MAVETMPIRENPTQTGSEPECCCCVVHSPFDTQHPVRIFQNSLFLPSKYIHTAGMNFQTLVLLCVLSCSVLAKKGKAKGSSLHESEFVNEEGVFELNKDSYTKIKHAVDLSFDSYETDNGKFESFEAHPDRAILEKRDETCYVAFRGTIFTDVFDWIQNLSGGDSAVCHKGSCCTVVTGFWNGYHTAYRDSMEEKIKECVKSCGKDGCELVLTGHSQGASIASVAAMYLKEYNPLLITFGMPRTIDRPCDLINEDRFIRFENSRDGLFGNTFDPVPYLSLHKAEHFGHQIMLGANGAAYLGMDELSFTPWDMGHAFITHRLNTREGYGTRIRALQGELFADNNTNEDDKQKTNESDEAIQIKGFPLGVMCAIDQQCESGYCHRRRCRERRRLRGERRRKARRR